MTRFLIGLLLGLLLGIAGTAAFLITAGGGDYLIVASPRVRELEASLKNVDQDRQWLRSRLDESNEALAKLESRFTGLTARFDSMSGAAHDGSTPGATAAPSPGSSPSTAPTPGDQALGGDDPSTAPVEKPESAKDGAAL